MKLTEEQSTSVCKSSGAEPRRREGRTRLRKTCLLRVCGLFSGPSALRIPATFSSTESHHGGLIKLDSKDRGEKRIF